MGIEEDAAGISVTGRITKEGQKALRAGIKPNFSLNQAEPEITFTQSQILEFLEDKLLIELDGWQREWILRCWEKYGER